MSIKIVQGPRIQTRECHTIFCCGAQFGLEERNHLLCNTVWGVGGVTASIRRLNEMANREGIESNTRNCTPRP